MMNRGHKLLLPLLRRTNAQYYYRGSGNWREGIAAAAAALHPLLLPRLYVSAKTYIVSNPATQALQDGLVSGISQAYHTQPDLNMVGPARIEQYIKQDTEYEGFFGLKRIYFCWVIYEIKPNKKGKRSQDLEHTDFHVYNKLSYSSRWVARRESISFYGLKKDIDVMIFILLCIN